MMVVVGGSEIFDLEEGNKNSNLPFGLRTRCSYEFANEKIKEKGRRYLVTVIMRERIFMRAFYRPIEFARSV